MTDTAVVARGRWYQHGQRKRLRRQAKQRIQARAERSGCPRPDKTAYDRNDPEERRIQQRALGADMHPYDCRCGFSHNGHPVRRLYDFGDEPPEPKAVFDD